MENELDPKAPFRQLLQKQEKHTDKKTYNASNCKPASTSAEIHQRSGECNMQDTEGVNQSSTVPSQGENRNQNMRAMQTAQHTMNGWKQRTAIRGQRRK